MDKKKSNRVREFIIEDRVFKTQVLFILNCSGKEFARRAKNYGVEKEMDEYVTGTVVDGADGNIFRIVWYEELSLRELGGLAHEVFHLVVRICEDKGIPIKANIEDGRCGDETAAYLLEFYMKELTKRIWG